MKHFSIAQKSSISIMNNTHQNKKRLNHSNSLVLATECQTLKQRLTYNKKETFHQHIFLSLQTTILKPILSTAIKVLKLNRTLVASVSKLDSQNQSFFVQLMKKQKSQCRH